MSVRVSNELPEHIGYRFGLELGLGLGVGLMPMPEDGLLEALESDEHAEQLRRLVLHLQVERAEERHRRHRALVLHLGERLDCTKGRA